MAVVSIRRDEGKLANLENLVEAEPISGHTGIGHTRWATHGEPSARNAHPHQSMDGKIVVVHNGIVENFLELREELEAEGAVFNSDTDTETIVHLIERYVAAGSDLLEAARQTFNQLKGAQAIVVLSSNEPGKLIACRIGNAGGVAIGVGKGEMYIASDIPAILPYTRDMVFLESRQIATVTPEGYSVTNLDGTPVETEVHAIPWDPVSAVKGEYKHFMQKEIFEQPRAITDTLGGRVDFEHQRVRLPELNLDQVDAKQLQRIITVACGTSYYSGLVGKFLIEQIARVPVEVAIGSEFRYSDPIIDDSMAVLAITQSGETVDTLAAMEEAREKGARLWSIVNAIGSQAMRVADGYIAMHAGPEIGVASTKAFTSSIVDQYLLACYLAQLRESQPADVISQFVADLTRLPDLVGSVLDRDDEYAELAAHFHRIRTFPLSGARYQLSDSVRRRAETEGDQLHTCGGVSGR